MTLSKRGKWIAAAIILLVVILIIIGIAYLPVWSTIEAFIMLMIGMVSGWLLRAKKEDETPVETPPSDEPAV